MVAAILVRLPLILMPLTSAPAPTADCQLEVLAPAAMEERALAQFTTAVDRYALLHRRLERSLPPEQLFADFEAMFDARETLAQALRDARPYVQRGNVFTPGVAQLFRDRIDGVIERHAAELRTAIADARVPGAFVPEVHEALPWQLPADMWPPLHRWPALLRALPPLPAELEYRFADRSLLLVDVHANIVVDVLNEALPEQ